MNPKRSSDLMRFGAFEVDFRAGELRKDGRKIKLQGLPFQFLMALLEQPGQVVPREDLVRRLWSDYAAVDVDNGLNTAAKKVRVALGDDAETPRFIETLPRRGYRFIGVVQAVTRAELADPQAPEVPDRGSAPSAAGPMAPGPSRRWWLAVPAVILLSLGAIRLLITARSPGMLRTVQLTCTGRVEPFNIILTDGSRIYFDERLGGRWSLAQVSVEGGVPSAIPAPPGVPMLQAISPNRSELLATVVAYNEEESPLWIIPTVAGSPRRLGSVLAHSGTWSRDGRSIVYGFGRALYRVNSDGTDPHKLADTIGLPFFLRRSPGQPDLLRFTITGPLYSVWECSADGSGVRRFPPARPWGETARGALGADWTPDGRYYLFQSREDHGTGFWAVREALDLLRPFGPRPFEIYTTATDAGVLAPSADGKRLFFAQGQDTRDLVRYDAKRNQFLPFLAGAAVRGIAFSNDGQWLAYEAISEGTLWRSRADGGERLQLTSPPMRISEPHWSMDGSYIAFTGTLKDDEDDARVYVVPPNGGSAEPIPLGPYHSSSPSWSGDGHSLMLNCWRPGARTETMAVCVMDWKTRQNFVVPGTHDLLRPAWSPDGQYVAALRESGTQVVLFDMHSHEWTPLADRANYGIPFWTRDGRFFYFQEVLGDTDQPIFRVNVATRAVERMMSSQQIPQSGFSGYMLTGLTPGDAPIATVLRRNGDLFALEVDLP